MRFAASKLNTFRVIQFLAEIRPGARCGNKSLPPLIIQFLAGAQAEIGWSHAGARPDLLKIVFNGKPDFGREAPGFQVVSRSSRKFLDPCGLSTRVVLDPKALCIGGYALSSIPAICNYRCSAGARPAHLAPQGCHP